MPGRGGAGEVVPLVEPVAEERRARGRSGDDPEAGAPAVAATRPDDPRLHGAARREQDHGEDAGLDGVEVGARPAATTVAWARMVKKAAKRPLKNINSEPSQIMTPMASIGGPVVDDVAPGRAGVSTEMACAHGVFPSRRDEPGANTLSTVAGTRRDGSRWAVVGAARRRSGPRCSAGSRRPAGGASGRRRAGGWVGSGRRTGCAAPARCAGGASSGPRRRSPPGPARPPRRRRTRGRWPGRRAAGPAAPPGPRPRVPGVDRLDPRPRRGPRPGRPGASRGQDGDAPGGHAPPARPPTTSATRSATRPGATCHEAGDEPDRRTGRGGVRPGAATASTRAATSTTSAGVR